MLVRLDGPHRRTLPQPGNDAMLHKDEVGQAMTEGIRAKSTYRFAKVPEWIVFHPDLQPIDVRVYAALDRVGPRKFPTLEYLGEAIGVSLDTARRAIARLAGAGAVEVLPTFTDQGRQTSNEYLLAADSPLGGRVAPVLGRGGTDATHGGSTGARAGIESKKNEKKNPSGSSRGTAIERARDPIFDALVAVCGIDYDEMTDRARKSCAVAAAELKRVHATPEKITRAANAWPVKFPHATMTPHAIANQYGQLLATPIPANLVRLSRGGEAIRRAAARGNQEGNHQ